MTTASEKLISVIIVILGMGICIVLANDFSDASVITAIMFGIATTLLGIRGILKILTTD